jgi:hypothetical protein
MFILVIITIRKRTSSIASFQKAGRRKFASPCHQDHARAVNSKQWATYLYRIMKLQQAMKNVFILTGTIEKAQNTFSLKHISVSKLFRLYYM